MSLIILIEEKIKYDEAITVSTLGGCAAIVTEANTLVAAPYLDVLVRLAETAESGDQQDVDNIILRGFAEGNYPVPFRDATRQIAESTNLQKRLGGQLQPILTKRLEQRTAGKPALIAAFALEALFQLAVAGIINKYHVIALMVDMGIDEEPLFAEHAAKLVGAAFHVWREADLLSTLDKLRADAEAEAAFEYGLGLLSQAFTATDISKIMEKMETAQALFIQSRHAGENRSDAAAYSAVINLLKKFSQDSDSNGLKDPLSELESAIIDRVHLLQDDGSLPQWLRPRADRELQWVKLLRIIKEATKSLKKPSWLNPAVVMEQLFAVYDADRTISVGSGLRKLLQPPIERAFLRERGLLTHLDDLLQDSKWMEENAEISLRLRKRIDFLVRGKYKPGKVLEDDPYPLLGSILQDNGLVVTIPQNKAEILEDAVRSYQQSKKTVANPIVQRIYSQMKKSFSTCNDYSGDVRDDFDELIFSVIQFCKTRHDLGRKELGQRGAYLFEPNAKEAELQSDLRDWLSGNYTRTDKLVEVSDVASGRTDIYIPFRGHRFIIELKRHLGQVDKQVARSYLSQTVAYQGTNVKLGMLGILELVDRTGPMPSLEECIWYDSLLPSGQSIARHALVFQVPGNKNTPSSMK